MTIDKSKLTPQGQISAPVEVCQRLGAGPGSVLEWDERDDEVIVRREGRYTSEEVHRALFPEAVPEGRPADVKDAIRKHIRKKHARR
jgi:bifunctional DNA-binding transcriptional regulator/antitoxin component of YhaV-PrlF toxin-antitoxin module